jgi:2-oxoglutarate dehydrogenase E2 component (dihydrolipoamide succinyltransferase)
MAEITIPSVGIAMEEALVVKWLKEPGDLVAVDDPVAEIETDKATMDIVSPVAGTLGPHLVEPGAIVPVGATIVHVIDTVEGPAAAPGDIAPDDIVPDDSVPGDSVSDDASAETAPAPVAAAEASEGERAAHGLSPRAPHCPGAGAGARCFSTSGRRAVPGADRGEGR